MPVDYTHRKTALDALTYALSSLKKELHALRLEIEAGQVPRVKGRAASKRLVARMDRMREAHSVLSCDQGAERTARQSEEIDSVSAPIEASTYKASGTATNKLVNLWVAQKLEDLAVQVRAGNLTRLEFNWQGGEDFDLNFTPIHPLKVISTTLVVEDTKA